MQAQGPGAAAWAGHCVLVAAVLELGGTITCSAVSTVALTTMARLDRGLCTAAGHRLLGPAAAAWLVATCRDGALLNARIMLAA